MPVSTVRWGAYEQNLAAEHAVYIKAGWFDAWAEVPFMRCTRATWSCAPGIGTAELTWRYGEGMRPGEAGPGVVYRRPPQHRFYVKIVIDENTVPGHPLTDLVWYGTLQVEVDQLAGTRLGQGPAGVLEAIASGRQRFTCYGLEQLLDLHTVTTSIWAKNATAETFIIDEGLAFNEYGLGNCSLGPVDGGFYVFGDEIGPENFRYWTTLDAVRYLLRYQTPRDWTGDVRIPFDVTDPQDALPAWDRPVLATHGRTTRSLLNQLIPRQRLLSYYTELIEGGGIGGGDVIRIQPFTFADVDVPADPFNVLKANPNQKILAFESDPTMSASVKRSTLDAVDFVSVNGAKRRNCFTVSVADGTFAEGFTNGIAGEYDAGASGAGDYPAADEIEDRQRRNADARKADRVATAYRRFQIVDDWDGLVGDGIGGAKTPAAPRDDNPALPYPLYPPALQLLDRLPLLERHDYDAAKIPAAITNTGAVPFDELPPLVLVNLPEDTDKYQYVEKVGSAAQLEDSADEDSNRRWSASVRIIPGSLAFEIRVSGAPQHVIALNHFTPEAEDEEIGGYDYDDFLVTLAIEDQRRCTATWPAVLPFVLEAARGLYLEAGDGFRLDYVAPGTVVGLDPETQEPLRSDNGGFVRDDREALEQTARVAFEWYRVTRKALSLTSRRLSKALWLGDLVLSTGDPTLPVVGDTHIEQIKSCVSEITVEIPHAEGLQPGLPSLSWQTAFGELDALHFAPRRGRR